MDQDSPVRWLLLIGGCADIAAMAASAPQDHITRSGSELSGDVIAKPTGFGGEVMAATVGVLCWLSFLIAGDPMAALELSWFLLMMLSLGGWALLMRLRLDDDRFARTIGPLRRSVDMAALQSITWKMTAGGNSRGMIFVRDQHGGRVPIYVGKFTRIDEWGPRLLDAAARCGATVDARSRRLLEGAGAPWTRAAADADPRNEPGSRADTPAAGEAHIADGDESG